MPSSASPPVRATRRAWAARAGLRLADRHLVAARGLALLVACGGSDADGALVDGAARDGGPRRGGRAAASTSTDAAAGVDVVRAADAGASAVPAAGVDAAPPAGRDAGLADAAQVPSVAAAAVPRVDVAPASPAGRYEGGVARSSPVAYGRKTAGAVDATVAHAR
jgi:hypothetical protein